jgi:hypothetical protein
MRPNTARSSSHPGPSRKSGTTSYGFTKYSKAISQGKHLLIIAGIPYQKSIKRLAIPERMLKYYMLYEQHVVVEG